MALTEFIAIKEQTCNVSHLKSKPYKHSYDKGVSSREQNILYIGQHYWNISMKREWTRTPDIII